jgi:hypothetical protein
MSKFIGILSLDTRFTRVKGDAGHPDSYHLPAVLRTIPGAEPQHVVLDGKPTPELVAAFRANAEDLVAEGAGLITSTCGFLISVQDDIARNLGVPVLLSGLCLLPIVQRMFAGAPIGVLTANSNALGKAAIEATGVRFEDTRIKGLQNQSLFAKTFIAVKSKQNVDFDEVQMEAEVVASARALVKASPDISAIVLECGNLPPYAHSIRLATGIPVFSLLDAARIWMPE